MGRSFQASHLPLFVSLLENRTGVRWGGEGIPQANLKGLFKHTILIQKCRAICLRQSAPRTYTKGLHLAEGRRLKSQQKAVAFNSCLTQHSLATDLLSREPGLSEWSEEGWAGWTLCNWRIQCVCPSTAVCHPACATQATFMERRTKWTKRRRAVERTHRRAEWHKFKTQRTFTLHKKIKCIFIFSTTWAVFNNAGSFLIGDLKTPNSIKVTEKRSEVHTKSGPKTHTAPCRNDIPSALVFMTAH